MFGAGHAFLLFVPVPAVGLAALKVIGVAEREVPVPDRRRLDFSVTALMEEVTEAITVDLLGKLDDPMLIGKGVQIHVIRIVVGARACGPVTGVKGLRH